MANMAYHDSEIGAALRYREILDRITAIGWRNYILWWIVLMLIVTVAGFIIGVVGGILLYFVPGLLVFFRIWLLSNIPGKIYWINIRIYREY